MSGMSNPMETQWWRRVLNQHRGKLFIVQAVAFVLMGVVIAGMFWQSPAEAQCAQRGFQGDARSCGRDVVDLFDAPADPAAEARQVSDLRDGFDPRGQDGWWHADAGDQSGIQGVDEDRDVAGRAKVCHARNSDGRPGRLTTKRSSATSPPGCPDAWTGCTWITRESRSRRATIWSTSTANNSTPPRKS